MSAEENIIEQVENQEVEEEIIKRLVNDVINEPNKYPTEAKVILTLETWHRQGPSFADYQRYDIISGEIREIVLDVIDEGYPYRLIRKIAIIPLAIPTVIAVESYSDTTSVKASKDIYVFTSDGWKVVHVY
jgi:uncharacterized protein (UPF0335 family)